MEASRERWGGEGWDKGMDKEKELENTNKVGYLGEVESWKGRNKA